MLEAELSQDEHAKLPEALRAEYTKSDDGRFRLAVREVNGWKLDNTTALRSALERERASVEEFKSKLRAFDGIDASKARDAQKKLEALESGEPDEKTKTKIDSIRKQLEEKHASELAPLKGLLASRETEIDALTVDTAIAKALGEVKLIEGGAALLHSHIRKNGLVRRIRGDDGVSAVKVFGSDGIELVTRESGKSGSMPVAELVGVVMRKEFPGVFIATDRKGGGTTTSPNGNKVENNSPEGLIAETRLANAWT